MIDRILGRGRLDVPSMSLRALASIGSIPRLIPISMVSGADTTWIQYVPDSRDGPSNSVLAPAVLLIPLPIP